MYQVNLFAVKGADWATAIEFINAEDNLPLDVSGVAFELSVQDHCECVLVSASTGEGTITFPESHIIAWRLTPAQLGALCPRTTYRVGCRMTDDVGTTQIFVGNLAMIDGEF